MENIRKIKSVELVVLDNGVSATQQYINVRNGRSEAEYIHPDTKDILGSTNGVCCIEENQEIITDLGLIAIKNVTTQHRVLTEDGTYQKVLKTIDQGSKQTLKITGSLGREIICTEDHKILTQFGWVEARNLTRSHLIKWFPEVSKKRAIESFCEKDWLIGILLADGHLSKNGPITVACANEEQAKYVAEVAKRSFNLNGSHIKFHVRCWYVYLVASNKKTNTPNLLKNYLRSLGLLGKKSFSKTLPLNFSISTLAGFYDGDGGINGTVRIKNSTLAKQLYFALLEYGVLCSLKHNKKTNVDTLTVIEQSKLPCVWKKSINKGKRWVPHTMLLQKYSILDKNTKRSIKKCYPQMVSKVKNILTDDVFNLNHTTWSRVLRITKDDICRVYDLSVENIHSFTVGGHVVHNCFQEQLMALLVRFAGYSLEESDQIRSAIAKKKHDVMTAAFDKIRIATAANGWTPAQAQGLCDILTAYSNYSFNKSHSYAYGQLGHITMFLKHHYPLEWWASELNLSGEDKLRKYMGVIGNIVKPPYLKMPSTEWQIIGNHIVAPLTSVKGIGLKPVTELMKNGPYESFAEFLNTNSGRTFHIGTFAACFKARALDCFMDEDLPYHDARKELIQSFFKIRGIDYKFVKKGSDLTELKNKQSKQKAFDPIFEEKDPFKLFLMEREVSKIFSKTLLDDEFICSTLEKSLPALKSTGKVGIPYVMGSPKGESTKVIKSIAQIEAILSKIPDPEDLFYGIFLFQGSSTASGISKKSGKPWKKVEVELSDGVRTVYCTLWDQDKPFRWPVNTPTIVLGKLKLDWRSRPTMDIKQISRVDEIRGV